MAKAEAWNKDPLDGMEGGGSPLRLSWGLSFTMKALGKLFLFTEGQLKVRTV